MNTDTCTLEHILVVVTLSQVVNIPPERQTRRSKTLLGAHAQRSARRNVWWDVTSAGQRRGTNYFSLFLSFPGVQISPPTNQRTLDSRGLLRDNHVMIAAKLVTSSSTSKFFFAYRQSLDRKWQARRQFKGQDFSDLACSLEWRGQDSCLTLARMPLKKKSHQKTSGHARLQGPGK